MFSYICVLLNRQNLWYFPDRSVHHVSSFTVARDVFAHSGFSFTPELFVIAFSHLNELCVCASCQDTDQVVGGVWWPPGYCRGGSRRGRIRATLSSRQEVRRRPSRFICGCLWLFFNTQICPIALDDYRAQNRLDYLALYLHTIVLCRLTLTSLQRAPAHPVWPVARYCHNIDIFNAFNRPSFNARILLLLNSYIACGMTW